MRICKKSISLMLAILTVLTVMVVGAVPTTLKTDAASWNGYNYGGGRLYGYQTFLEAFGIDYDEYMKWMDDHDRDSPNPNYYLGTPYAHNDHRNPRGDCQGARGAYDSPGVAAMNCTGFVWHVLYKSAVASGAPGYKIDRLSVMGGVPASWINYGVYRIWFDSVEDAYDSGVLEKGDLMWLYGTGDNHNAIFYGDSPKDFIYWDSAGERNRYCEVHAIGESKGLWVAKVTQPNRVELQIDTPSGGKGSRFGTKYMIFNSKAKAQAALDNPDSDAAWDKREGTIVLDSDGHGCFREQGAPSASELWNGNTPRTNHSYFSSDAERVDSDYTYYAVQWSHGPGISEDDSIHVFKDSGKRTPSGYRIFNFYAPIHVDTPEFSSITSNSDGVLMKWKAIKDAYKYRIYYKNRYNDWTRMAETSSTSYLDTDVKNGSSYIYTIRCVDKYGNFISEHNSNGWRHTYRILDTPKFTSLKSTAEGVQLNWSAVQNTIDDSPTRYRVYYKNGKGGWTKMTETTDTSYTDTIVDIGGNYTYTIRCVDANGNFVSKYNTTGWKHTYQGIATPQMTEITAQPEGVSLKWDGTEGVYRYCVYCQKKDGGWLRIKETDQTEFFDENVEAGKTYTYTLRCINSSGNFVSGFNKNGWKVTYNGVDTPQITELTAQPDGVNIAWEPVENAVKYRLYRKTPGGSWNRILETDQTAYFDEDITQKTDYIYTLRCVNNSGGFMSKFKEDGWSVHYEGIDTPQITELTAQPDGVNIAWEPVENAINYRLYRKTPGGSWNRILETADTAYFDTDITEQTDYIYTVRCVNNSDGFMSDFNKDGWNVRYEGVETPQITEIGSTPDGVHIVWSPVENAVNYRLYRKEKGGAWNRILETAETEYTDSLAELNTEYIYTVRCVNADGGFMSDCNYDGWKATYEGVDIPEFSEVKNEPEGIRLTWEPIEGVTSYRVYARGNNGWDRLTETAGSEFFDTVEYGATRVYTIRCMNSVGEFASEFNENGWEITYTGVDTPQITALESTAEGVKITWTPVEGTVKYRVFYKGRNGWERLCTIDGTEFVDDDVRVGGNYTYTVRCVGARDTYISDYNRSGSRIQYQPPVEEPEEPEPQEQPE